MKIQGHIIPPKDSNNLVTDTKGMKTYNLPDKEVKIIVLRKLNELRTLTKRNHTKEPNQNSIQKIQMSEMKSAVENINIRMDLEERIWT